MMLRSSFQALWVAASEGMDLGDLEALRATLLMQRGGSVTTQDREILAMALSELDGLIVTRQAQRLGSQSRT